MWVQKSLLSHVSEMKVTAGVSESRAKMLKQFLFMDLALKSKHFSFWVSFFFMSWCLEGDVLCSIGGGAGAYGILVWLVWGIFWLQLVEVEGRLFG